MIVDLFFQLVQMTLVIAVAPLLTGLVRATKARRACCAGGGLRSFSPIAI